MSVIDSIKEADKLFVGSKKVVLARYGSETLYEDWPLLDVSVNIDEHTHGVEPTTVPYGQSYQSDEITVDAGYCIKSVEVIME